MAQRLTILLRQLLFSVQRQKAKGASACTCHEGPFSFVCVRAAVGKDKKEKKNIAAACWRKLLNSAVCNWAQPKQLRPAVLPGLNPSSFSFTAVRPVELGSTADDGPLCLYGR